MTNKQNFPSKRSIAEAIEEGIFLLMDRHDYIYRGMKRAHALACNTKNKERMYKAFRIEDALSTEWLRLEKHIETLCYTKELALGKTR